MKKSIGVMLLLGAFFFMLSSANATIFTFSDKTIFWPTWGNGKDDGKDLVGNYPDISNVYVITTGQILNQIKITMSQAPWLWGGAALFIDTDKDQDWDFYAFNSQTDYNNPNFKYSLYKLEPQVHLVKDVNDIPYDFPVDVIGQVGREGHPAKIKDTRPKTAYLTYEYGYDEGSKILTYSFLTGTNNVTLSDLGWGIGFTVGCANDVFLTSTPDIPVPESATLLLLCTGLIGLAGFGKRKFFRK